MREEKERKLREERERKQQEKERKEREEREKQKLAEQEQKEKLAAAEKLASEKERQEGVASTTVEPVVPDETKHPNPPTEPPMPPIQPEPTTLSPDSLLASLAASVLDPATASSPAGTQASAATPPAPTAMTYESLLSPGKSTFSSPLNAQSRAISAPASSAFDPASLSSPPSNLNVNQGIPLMTDLKNKLPPPGLHSPAAMHHPLPPHAHPPPQPPQQQPQGNFFNLLNQGMPLSLGVSPYAPMAPPPPPPQPHQQGAPAGAGVVGAGQPGIQPPQLGPRAHPHLGGSSPFINASSTVTAGGPASTVSHPMLGMVGSPAASLANTPLAAPSNQVYGSSYPAHPAMMPPHLQGVGIMGGAASVSGGATPIGHERRRSQTHEDVGVLLRSGKAPSRPAPIQRPRSGSNAASMATAVEQALLSPGNLPYGEAPELMVGANPALLGLPLGVGVGVGAGAREAAIRRQSLPPAQGLHTIEEGSTSLFSGGLFGGSPGARGDMMNMHGYHHGMMYENGSSANFNLWDWRHAPSTDMPSQFPSNSAGARLPNVVGSHPRPPSGAPSSTGDSSMPKPFC
ncbi:uncharacterized protein VTP21DRAFT_2424 [Calcarisporiella thermophila]|uniref:uncharacterized protein n=1 Tax=Calcarisporiella thermophila TaxID=911321 RepID=UPI0037443400